MTWFHYQNANISEVERMSYKITGYIEQEYTQKRWRRTKLSCKSKVTSDFQWAQLPRPLLLFSDCENNSCHRLTPEIKYGALIMAIIGGEQG